MTTWGILKKVYYIGAAALTLYTVVALLIAAETFASGLVR